MQILFDADKNVYDLLEYVKSQLRIDDNDEI